MSEDDRIARLVDRLAAMPREDREHDPEVVALPDDELGEVLALSEQRRAHYREKAEADGINTESFDWAADADLFAILDEGYAELGELRGMATQPYGLLAVLDQVGVADRRVLVRALFAVLLDMIVHEDEDAPPAFVDLDRRYVERLVADEPDPPDAVS